MIIWNKNIQDLHITQTYAFHAFFKFNFCTTVGVLFLPPPTLSEAEVPPDPTLSLTLLSFCPPLWSFPFNSFRLPPAVPSPDTHPLQTEVRVQVLAASSETKVYFRDSASCNSYFRDSSRWCHCSPGVSIQSDTLKSPLQNQAGSIFKKNQLGGKELWNSLFFTFFQYLITFLRQ